MFNFFKTGSKEPVESEGKDPWEEVRTEPVLKAGKETEAQSRSVASSGEQTPSPFEEVAPASSASAAFADVPPPAPRKAASSGDPLEAPSPFEAAPTGRIEPTAPSEPSLSAPVEPETAAQPVVPAWTSAAPAAEKKREEPSWEEAERPEPMVTEPVPKEAVRRVREEERRAEGETEEDSYVPTHEEVMRQKRVRHRMIGAAALLLALVLVTPFALDDEERLTVEKMDLDIPDPQTVETTIAPEPPAPEGEVLVAGDGGGVSTGAANLENEAAQSADGKTAAKSDAQSEEKAQAKPSQKPAAKPDAKTDAKPQSKSEGKSDSKPAASTAPTGEGYYIQVLATSSELSAEKLVKDMALQGLPAYKTSVKQNGKTLWRVRAGLFKTKEEAESASGLLMLNNYVKEVIVSYQKGNGK